LPRVASDHFVVDFVMPGMQFGSQDSEAER